ncbi:MAG: MBL fold metallo-hydrolase [Melioribacteraceae bacterium]
MLKLQKFTFNPFQENTYILWDKITLEAAVIDPGCISSEEETALLNFISEEKLKVKYLINTHCHIDHVLGNAFVKEKYGCKFYAPELDVPFLEKVIEQGKMFGMEVIQSPNPDEFITEDLILKLGELKMKFIFTPGHTPGEYCLYFESEKICIAGDVLFKEGIGRTDLWGGDYETLISSIQEKLFVLPDEVKVFPGHGDATTIGHEIIHNPFLI